MENKDFENRIRELSERALCRGVAAFTGFLSPSEIEKVKSMRLPCPAEFFGGAEFAERKMAAFGFSGAADDLPLAIIKIEPRSEKFFSAVTHRDFLGAMLGLGIERDRTGDIFTDGKSAFAVVDAALKDFFIENLVKVGANPVRTRGAEAVPPEFAPKREKKRITVSSVRLDAIISRVYNLPRAEGAALIENEKVSSDGRTVTSAAFVPKDGQTIAVRGYGKFRVVGCEGISSKGKTVLGISIYK